MEDTHLDAVLVDALRKMGARGAGFEPLRFALRILKVEVGQVQLRRVLNAAVDRGDLEIHGETSSPNGRFAHVYRVSQCA